MVKNDESERVACYSFCSILVTFRNKRTLKTAEIQTLAKKSSFYDIITENNGYEHQEVYEAFHEDAGGNEVFALNVRLVVGERSLYALCEKEH